MKREGKVDANGSKLSIIAADVINYYQISRSDTHVVLFYLEKIK